MGLYRAKTPDELRGATVLRDANKPEPTANKSKRGRPVKSTGDAKKDARNAQQRELMRQRRAASK